MASPVEVVVDAEIPGSQNRPSSEYYRQVNECQTGCSLTLVAGVSYMRAESMTTFSYSLTLTDSDHIWLNRIITSVIEDPTNDIRLRGAARELRRKVRDAEDAAIMRSTSSPCWPDTPES